MKKAKTQILKLRQLALSNEEGYKILKEVERDPWTAKLLEDESATDDLRATTTYNKYVTHSNLTLEMKQQILFEVPL